MILKKAPVSKVVLSAENKKRLVDFVVLLMAIDKRVNPNKRSASKSKKLKSHDIKARTLAGLVFLQESFIFKLSKKIHILEYSCDDRHQSSRIQAYRLGALRLACAIQVGGVYPELCRRGWHANSSK
jgi:hypothetical protein